MDKYKGMNGRRFRTEGLIETSLPVPYYAPAMPGATVLGADGQLYFSQKASASSAYEWLRASSSSRPRANIMANVNTSPTPYAPYFQIEGFVSDAAQSIVSINSTASLVLGRANGTNIGDNGAITPADTAVGALIFHGSDGTNLYPMARVNCLPGGTVGTQITPGRLQLGVRLNGSTGGVQNVLIISSDGNVQINNTTGTERLSVNGNIQVSDGGVMVGANPVVGSRKTGWTAPAGTASKSTFDTATVTTAQLAERVKALIDDLTAHGLIGA